MFGTWSQVRAIHLAVVTIVGIMLCITLNGLPAGAQPSGNFNSYPANWHDYYQNWGARCMPQADNSGRWGRQRQNDAWCKENLRFRGAQPDSQWRHDRPWDHGYGGDSGGNPGGENGNSSGDRSGSGN